MLLEHRPKQIIKIIANEREYVSAQYLADVLGVSVRTVYSDVDSLNSTLITSGYSPIINVRGKGYKGNLTELEILLDNIDDKDMEILMDQKTRVSFIIALILAQEEKIDIDYFLDMISVSRNTLFNDLKNVRDSIGQFNLNLQYAPKIGYTIEGELIVKRSVFMLHLIELKKNVDVIEVVLRKFVEKTRLYENNLSKLKLIEEELNTEYIDDVLDNLAILMSVETLQIVKENDELELMDEVIDSKEYHLVCKYFSDFNQFNKTYYAIHLLGSMKQIRSASLEIYKFHEIAIDMVEKFQRLAAIEFKQVSLLVHNLSYHLSISYFRYRYGLHLSNPLLNQIKEKYGEVFHITDLVCDIIRDKLNVPVSSDEVAYIAMHFYSFIRRKDFSEHSRQIVIVCPQGLSTSALLKREIEQLDSKIKIYKCLSVRQFYEREEEMRHYTIISTHELTTDINYLQVSPILNQHALKRISAFLNVEINESVVKTEDIMEIVSPYLTKEQIEIVYQKVNLILDKRDSLSLNKTITLEQIMFVDSVKVVEKYDDYKEMVFDCSRILEIQGCVNQEYAKAIISALDKFGPYMVTGNGYSILHASYLDGVHSLGVGFMKLIEPIDIMGKKTNKIFILSPVDQQRHLGVMAQLLQIMQDERLTLEIDRINDENILLELLLENSQI